MGFETQVELEGPGKFSQEGMRQKLAGYFFLEHAGAIPSCGYPAKALADPQLVDCDDL
jgi:hypothetical protein